MEQNNQPNESSNVNNQEPVSPMPERKSDDDRKSNKRWLVIFGIAVALLVIGFVIWWMMQSNNQQSVARVIKIGFIAPQSGENAGDGINMKRGLDLAQKEFSQENTTIQIVSKDTQCDSEKAAAAVKDLITVDKVVAIIGEDCSAATLGAAPVAQANQVVLISPSSSNPDITKSGDYIFRTIQSDAFQGVFVADLIHKTKLNKLAIIYSDEAYGKGLGNAAKSNFEKLGGQVVAFEAADRTATDFSKQFATVKAANPDAVFIVTNSENSASAALISAKNAGLTAKLYGSEAFKDDAILADAGAAGEGLIICNPRLTISDTFNGKYRAVYGKDNESGDTVRTYDAFTALAMAIKQGASTGSEIKDKLLGVSFEGASGNIKFDENGDLASGKYDIFTIKGGQFVSVPQE